MAERRTPGGAGFSRRLSVDDIRSREGLIEATAGECAQLAALCRIERLASLRLAYRLDPIASHRYRLTGELRAEVTQACVVTLEPVEEHIREAVSVECWPEHQFEAASTADAADIGDAAELADPPEPVIAGRIDIGALAAQLLASAINPYPRKPGAEFSWQEAQEAHGTGKSGAFAGLARLRRDD